jgi:hypothetical protein
MSLRSFVPALQPVDKTGIILISTILFFHHRHTGHRRSGVGALEHHPALSRVP